jgi:adenylylsulfate kinase
MKILIFGLPGSGKTTLAKPLAELLGAVHINADEVREEYNDWDFTPEGRMRQANRMRHLSDGAVKAGAIAVTDFVCPTEEARLAFNPDFTVWMDTIEEGRYEDTNKMFVPPTQCDYKVSEWFDDTHQTLMQVISVFMQRKHSEKRDQK